MKKYIAPSILSADFKVLGEQLATIETAGADMVHVDVMDGLFVPSISFGMPVVESIRSATTLQFDVHMMVTKPERYVQTLRDAGADIISVHVEACDDVTAVLKLIKGTGAKPALAFNPDTPVETLRPYLPYVDEVVLMSVFPGFGGQKFIEESYVRIKELADLRAELKLQFLIEVDGGVNTANIQKVLEAGTDIAVAGSAVFKGDVTENVKNLLKVTRSFGE